MIFPFDLFPAISSSMALGSAIPGNVALPGESKSTSVTWTIGDGSVRILTHQHPSLLQDSEDRHCSGMLAALCG